jgi:hypothetical protein
MIYYGDYVAGWLDTTIQAFLDALPRGLSRMRYALVTCLDSNRDPKSILDVSPELSSWVGNVDVRVLGSGLLLPTGLLLKANSDNRVFFGSDEVWFFPAEPTEPKPDSAWLVAPPRINQARLDRLGRWMATNSCSLALGDGDGLNFVVKSRGIVKHLLGHSIVQPEPGPAVVAAPPREIAG